MNSQKIGALSAWYCGLAYILGFLVLIFWLSPLAEDGLDPLLKLEFLIENKLPYQFWLLFVFLGVGLALVFLVGAIAQLTKPINPNITAISKSFGLIWAGLLIASGMVASIGLNQVEVWMVTDKAQALLIWSGIEAVHLGLGGGIELVGGVWVLLLSLAFSKGKIGPTFLNVLGYITGIFGILTAIPSLERLGAAFGLLQILWFGILGLFLWKEKKYHLLYLSPYKPE